MNGLFRRNDPGLLDYVALAVAALAYATALALVMVPDRFAVIDTGQPPVSVGE